MTNIAKETKSLRRVDMSQRELILLEKHRDNWHIGIPVDQHIIQTSPEMFFLVVNSTQYRDQGLNSVQRGRDFGVLSHTWDVFV